MARMIWIVLGFLVLIVGLMNLPAWAFTAAGQEFQDLQKKIQHYQCEELRLTLEMADAIQTDDHTKIKELGDRMKEVQNDPEYIKLQSRLEEVKKKVIGPKGGPRNPKDVLPALSAQVPLTACQ